MGSCFTRPDPSEQAKLAKIKQQPRRQGYAAESVSAERLSSFKPPIHPKSEAATNQIKRLMLNNHKLKILFSTLDENNLNSAILAMYLRPVAFNETVITQGEPGDAFYVVKSGTFEIFVKRGEKAAEKVAQAGHGSFFGEAALMWHAPRAATVKCMSQDGGKLWALDGASFQMLIASTGVTKKKEVESFLEKIPILAELNRYEVSQLAEILAEEAFKSGEILMKQDEVGDRFFILVGGSAAAFIDGPEGTFKVKLYEMAGNYFGELALLGDVPRRASVIAGDEGCRVLVVSKDDFNRVLGPIVETLRRNADSYPQYEQFLK